MSFLTCRKSWKRVNSSTSFLGSDTKNLTWKRKSSACVPEMLVLTCLRIRFCGSSHLWRNIYGEVQTRAMFTHESLFVSERESEVIRLEKRQVLEHVLQKLRPFRRPLRRKSKHE